MHIGPSLPLRYEMKSSIASQVGETNFNPKHAVSWLEEQPEELQLWQVMFEELLICAEKPRQYSGNACVKLHGFVEQCSKSSKPALRNFAFAEGTAIRLFDFFMEWNEKDSHRSMRLVLDYLAYAISNNPRSEVGTAVKATILNTTIATITQQASRPSVKSAMVVLDCFIQKKLVYLSSVLELYKDIHSLPPDEDVWDAFVTSIFAWMEMHYLCHVVGNLLVTIFTSSWYEDKDVKHEPNTWHRFIYRGLQINLDFLEPIKFYVFVQLFNVDRPGSLLYLRHLSSLQRLTAKDSKGWDLNSMLWLAMLEAGKKVGVVDEPGRELEQGSQPGFQLQADVLESVLCHDFQEARTSAVSLLIASPSTTKPYTAEALDLLKKYLPSFYEDPDPKMRYDVLGHSRNMIKRIQNTIESLRREADRLSKKMNKVKSGKPKPRLSTEAINEGQLDQRQDGAVMRLNAALRQHEDFVSWYVGFLKNELAPTTSYQRHITALKAMAFIIKPVSSHGSGILTPSELSTLLIDPTWFRSILDLIMDPFDDVRETAASLVMALSPETGHPNLQRQMNKLGKTPMEELRSFCNKADELARRTARADHSDGAARSFELLCRWSTSSEERMQIPLEVLSSLETKLSAAEQDLANAVLQAPVHGSFASLRYIWNSFSSMKFSKEDLEALAEIQDRAVICCQRIWQTVRHVLCDDSPEGHLPEELEEVEGLDTKDLLSYSFRAIHESSNLMRAIASNASHQSPGLLAPSRANFETIGMLTFDELSNLRHRGAFTTVSQTFTSCCQLVKWFPHPSSDKPGFLDQWYEGALACIHTQASTTRRSAGIPALIVGILSSNASRPSFEEVIRNLQDIGRRPALASETDGSNLPQVHALNCIKDIFKSSYLSKRAEPYLTDCLELAASSLKSEIWAIRNCGLLLLRSLIDCLFGTSESKTSIEAGWDGRTVKISYAKFKALPALLVNLLETGQQSSGVLIGTQTAESVFPALDIIRRAGPPEEFRDRLYSIISWYLGSHIWHVREIAARTLCSFLLKPTWLDSIADLLAGSKTSNKLHGVLLTLKFLNERLSEVMPEQLSDANIRKMCTLLEELVSRNESVSTCPETRAVYIEVVNFITGRLNTTENAEQTGPAVESRSILPSWVFEPNNQPGGRMVPSALLDIRLGQAALLQAVQQPSRKTGDVLKQLLIASLEGDVNVACSILETMSSIDSLQSIEAQGNLINTYIQVCLETDAPEPRTIALENMATLIDRALCDKSMGLNHLPANEVITELWTDLHGKPMNPSLSDAIVRVSGPLLAALVLRSEEITQSELEPWLRSWGAMMSEAGMADRTFDTRMAAVSAMNSFSNSIASRFTSTNTSPGSAHLPWLIALYDALNDDDDEVRAAAASAATPLLSNQHLVSVEAGRRLLHWLSAHYGDVDEFRAHVVCRMTGNIPSLSLSLPGSSHPTLEQDLADSTSPIAKTLLQGWTPPEAQLADAMRFDDSLFVVEEQNLYVDEVREAYRWSNIFSSLPPSSSSCSSSEAAATITTAALSQWCLSGLDALSRIAVAQGVDGPLGWTSKPEVFAICARVVIGGVAALATTAAAGGGDERVRVGKALRRFRDEGRRAEVSGLLLDMCGVGEVDA
ncbi:putative death-receptor fusion protein-domain-containing protein [Daldinia caldariorum]|uniref:putative death-receptor fusion protein-domain-containing protein n=1 Tax=Daldinia caldariorum TaxID=326644 RepID=UPI002007D2BB|nr:putative death-receptor fusion protein-domain-containing protein [Daldinia caldariorum]KAI1467217.1 putative death-receptor fusion protein-domain-containing protein [Daldinia caldariorum]